MIVKWFQRLLTPAAAQPADKSGEMDAFKGKFPAFFGEGERTSSAHPSSSLPLLPLRNLVLYPGAQASVIVGRNDSIQAIEKALKQNNKIVVVAQRDTELSMVQPETDLYPVGVTAEITQHVRLPDGTWRLQLTGKIRVKLLEFLTIDEPLEVVFLPLLDDPHTDPLVLEAARRYLTEQFSQFVQSLNTLPEELLPVLESLNQIEQNSYLLASYLPADLRLKQQLLENLDKAGRLTEIGKWLHRESEILDISRDIRQQAGHKLKQSEREYILREQLKVIKKELKENGTEEADSDVLLAQVEEKKLPESAAKQVREEIVRLQKMPSFSPEAGLIRNYIDFMLALPWHTLSKEGFDLNKVGKKLDRDHYGLEKAKERILEFLAVRKLAPGGRGPILCLVGPPGTGKTSLARSVSEALGRTFIRISLGGVRDEAEIRGHRRTYIGALPGRLIKGMKQAGVINPLMLLDEIDKLDSDLRGDPTAALLEVLDPEQNDEYTDHFLDTPYDLSKVFFITTANSLFAIPEPLIDRLEIIQLSSYTEEEKLKIAQLHLIPRQIEEHGLGKICRPVFAETVIRQIIRGYTREAGVRELERKIAQICRKIARQTIESKAATKSKTLRITDSVTKRFLGASKYNPDGKDTENQIGVATGLAWTEVGGEILPIEVSLMPGKGNLTITGQLGEVMQESAKAALSYIRAREKEFKLSRNFLDKYDLHIHAPEGAVPKDGPSAGIAIASALISALTKQAVNANVAMTGEITLRGRVLAIGGLKEKLIAAHRAGIENVLIPQKNAADLDDIPRNVRDALNIVTVSNMDEVVRHALVIKTITTRTPRVRK